MKTATRIHGFVAPGFEEVRAEFERNFTERGEIGAAVAAYWRGEKVVDLWGGRRDARRRRAMERGHDGHRHVHDQGPRRDDAGRGERARLARLRRAGRAATGPSSRRTARPRSPCASSSAHEAGLVLLDEKLTIEKLRDLDYMARLLARQKPAWPPGTRHGYHTMTIGLYMQELIRRVDPAHRTLGRFFHEEIAEPLGLEFYIGLPPEIPDARLAKVKPLTPWRGAAGAALHAARRDDEDDRVRGRCCAGRSSGLGVDPNDRRYLEVEVPAGNGVGTARAIARAYSAFAEGGAELGITPETFARITAPPEIARAAWTKCWACPSYFSLGFLRPGPAVVLRLEPARVRCARCGRLVRVRRSGRAPRLRVRDEQAGLLPGRDPREKALRDALYRTGRPPSYPEGEDDIELAPGDPTEVYVPLSRCPWKA